MIVGRWCVQLSVLWPWHLPLCVYIMFCWFHLSLLKYFFNIFCWFRPFLFFYVTECIVCVTGHDPLTFFLSPFLFFVWAGVLWPQLFKVLKPVHWVHCILFPPVSLKMLISYLSNVHFNS